MHPSSASAVRLLAAWQQQRRELTDRLDSLLLHGPTAVDRVSSRAEELREALLAEQRAFEAFVLHAVHGAAVPVVPEVRAPREYPPLRAVPHA
ncbi:MAG: hypothetical protein JWM64_391 [Frankiales bacterium]|nr:hypothetical protein [Frankiales bacterium]